MIGNYTICSIVIGLLVTVLLGLIFHYAYDKLLIDHWIPQTIIMGVVIILLMVCVGMDSDTDTNVEKSIENTIIANYDNVYMYHNDKADRFFLSDDSKYTFNYDEKTDTLIVFNNNSDVDAVFVDGIRKKCR